MSDASGSSSEPTYHKEPVTYSLQCQARHAMAFKLLVLPGTALWPHNDSAAIHKVMMWIIDLKLNAIKIKWHFCPRVKIKRVIARPVHETGRLRTDLSIIKYINHPKINGVVNSFYCSKIIGRIKHIRIKQNTHQ